MAWSGLSNSDCSHFPARPTISYPRPAPEYWPHHSSKSSGLHHKYIHRAITRQTSFPLFPSFKPFQVVLRSANRKRSVYMCNQRAPYAITLPQSLTSPLSPHPIKVSRRREAPKRVGGRGGGSWRIPALSIRISFVLFLFP